MIIRSQAGSEDNPVLIRNLESSVLYSLISSLVLQYMNSDLITKKVQLSSL